MTVNTDPTLGETIKALQNVSDEILSTLTALGRVQMGIQSTLQSVIEAQRQLTTSSLPPCNTTPTQHRREHRAGRTAKLDTDMELQAFVLARIDRLTYPEIAADVAKHFPAKRRIGKSAIHSWWNRKDVKAKFTG